MLEALKLIVFGAVIGVANVIPGVSGGTMAVILGIYDKFIEGISLRNFKKNWKFLLPLGIGMVVAVLLFSKGVDFLLGTWPVPTSFAFLGMILGSVPAMFSKARRTGFGAKGIVAFIVAFALMVIMAWIFIAGYTSRTKDWLNTLAGMQGKPAVTEVENGIQQQPDP